jgi:general secretion pathway protein A
MYLERYRLLLKPFQITPDPKFLWLGDKHREALAALHSGLVNRGIMLLTGESGTGKTVLIKRLISELDGDAFLLTLESPDLSRRDFYKLFSDALKISPPFYGRDEAIPHLRRMAQHSHAGDRKQVLIIDEAHRLNQDLLEEIRWLANPELQNRKLLDMAFVGQPEINDLLLKPENHGLAQKITRRHQIEPLEERELASYIEHRLEIAGCDLELFNTPAIFVIYELTGGIPGLINTVCNQALLTGDSRKLERIDANVIRQAAAKLNLPNVRRKRKDHPQSSDTKVQPAGGMKNIGWVFPPQDPSELEAEPPPQPRSGRKSFYAVPLFLLLAAFFAYHFDFLIAEEGPRRSDDMKGSTSAGPTAESKKNPSPPLRTEVMPSASPAKENRPASSLNDNILITFEINSNALDHKSLRLLDTLAVRMVQHPEQTIIIRGYTDSSGPIELNERISRLRAEAVKTFFTDKGIASERIEVVAMGPRNPIASNDTVEGRRQNRRVEIEFPPD